MDTKEQEKLLLEKGWKPVYDDIHMRDPEYVYPILVGWLKEPSMRTYSTDLAYEKERKTHERFLLSTGHFIIEGPCKESRCS